MDSVKKPIISVQNISQRSARVPPEYIQHPENRSKKEPPFSNADSSPISPSIPVIDLHGFDQNQFEANTVRNEIARACSEWGAFQVINHSIPTQLMGDMRNMGVSFFKDTPMSEKVKYASDPNIAASEGYGSRMLSNGDNNVVLDWRDYFDHHTLPLSRRDPSRWPHFPANYRNIVTEYSDNMKWLAQRLLGFVSESLGLSFSKIEDAVGDFYQNITSSYYPPCPQPELTLGLQAHSDMGAITLLIQDDVVGLEVFKDGEWVTVQPLSEGIVVILADQTEIITNGAYRSAQHRAITNRNSARLSIATFHDPAKTVKICPASELVVKDSNGPRYRDVLYGEYVSLWYTKGPEGKRNIDALLI